MKRSTDLIINIGAAIIYIVAANPLVTGLMLHEWLCLGLTLVFVIHCARHFDWIVATIQKHTEKASVANLVLDIITLLTFMVVTVSGLMISRHVLPQFGLVAQGYFFWNPIHYIAAKILFALLLVHIAAHWRWFSQLLNSYRQHKKDRENQTS